MDVPDDSVLIEEGNRLALNPAGLDECPLERLVLIDAAQQRQSVAGQPRRVIQDAISEQTS